MVVQSLGHQLQCQVVPSSARLLQLCSLVLEPDLDLRFVECQLGRQGASVGLVQVSVAVESRLEARQLLAREGRAQSFGIRCSFLSPSLPRSWTCSTINKTLGSACAHT